MGAGKSPWIIPANTGRIVAVHWVTGLDRDHPREYGENSFMSPHAPPCAGSSPRIRGELCRRESAPQPVGIIPANTGRISTSMVSTPLSRDHPREYGENSVASTADLVMVGSSPRIRGEYVVPHGGHPHLGIIPANTGRMPPSSLKSLVVGSSPRIRGEFHILKAHIGNDGIIPANTGRIRMWTRPPTPSGDHPREYGEN